MPEMRGNRLLGHEVAARWACALVTILMASLYGLPAAGAAPGGSANSFSLRPQISTTDAPCSGSTVPGTGSETGKCFQLGDAIVDAKGVHRVRLVQQSESGWEVALDLDREGRTRHGRFLRTHPAGTAVAFVVNGQVVGTAKTTDDAPRGAAIANVLILPQTVSLSAAKRLGVLTMDVVDGPRF
jgi:preprotein translocase subunit SecD